MEHDPGRFQSAIRDFNQLRLKATLQEALSKLIGHSNELLSFEEVAKKLKLASRREKGIQDIPLAAIVGSVGRYHDFNRQFLPLQSSEQERNRWARVKASIDDPQGFGWPPIEVYKIGEAYFVLDGNHRVSVARQEGFKNIQANVIEFPTEIPITPDLNMDDLILKAEYADFLIETGIRNLLPGVDLTVSAPGQYNKLRNHIEVHRYFMGIDQQRDIKYPEALIDWYENIYSPVIGPLLDRGLLHYFPGRTITDLYLWISEYRVELENELGWKMQAGKVIEEMVFHSNQEGQQNLRETCAWRKSRLVERFTDSLFKDILLPIDKMAGSEDILQQALRLAKWESARLHGLHVENPQNLQDEQDLEFNKKQFLEECEKNQVEASYSIVVGEPAKQILARSLLTDLVIIKVLHPPGHLFTATGAGLRTIIHNLARPLLAVSSGASGFSSALVAFDGSVKAREALYLAAYMAERWGTKLTIASLNDKSAEDSIALAKQVLDFYELSADYLIGGRSYHFFLDVVRERAIDVVTMGSYSGNPFNEIIIGSMVNNMLQESQVPLMICR